MRYEIWSNVSYRQPKPNYNQFLQGYRPEAVMEKSWEAEFTHYDDLFRDSPENALEYLFALFNQDNRPNRTKVHSLSVGDVIVLQGLGAWAVASVGFECLQDFASQVLQ